MARIEAAEAALEEATAMEAALVREKAAAALEAAWGPVPAYRPAEPVAHEPFFSPGTGIRGQSTSAEASCRSSGLPLVARTVRCR